MKSYCNGPERRILHNSRIIAEDHLDVRWHQQSGEVVDELIFLSCHTAVSNGPALTVHPIGAPHLREGEVPPQGGKPGWATPPNPRIGPWLLKGLVESRNLVHEFEITLEGTHHGPETNKPSMFLAIGSTDEYWKRPDAAQVIAQLVWEGLRRGGAPHIGYWSRIHAVRVMRHVIRTHMPDPFNGLWKSKNISIYYLQ